MLDTYVNIHSWTCQADCSPPALPHAHVLGSPLQSHLERAHRPLLVYTSSGVIEALRTAGTLQQPHLTNAHRWGPVMCHLPSKTPLNKYLIEIVVLLHNSGQGRGCWSYPSTLMENLATLCLFPSHPAENNRASTAQ